MKKFFEPLRGKAKKEHYILNIIGCFGIIPISYLMGGFTRNFWLFAGLFLLWNFILYLSYLTFCYFKNNHKKQ